MKKPSEEKIKLKKLKELYVNAGYADKNTKWYWNKDEQAYCLPLKPIIL